MTNNEHKAAPTVAGLESLTRYEEYFRGDCYAGMDDSKDGEWVRFADVERWAASHAGASAVLGEVPADVRRALDRMCTPLDDSRLGGATAEEDARCMRIIKQHIEGAATPSTAAVRAAALEEAAKLCEQIETERFDAYKGRGQHEPNNAGRADPYVNGESDGAGQCANKIRALINTPAADGGNGGEG